MPVSLSPEARGFLRRLGDELRDAKVTPAQGEQIRVASHALHGGEGPAITDAHVEKVAKDLKLPRDQRAAIRFALLVDVIGPSLGNSWREAAGSAAQSVRKIATRASSDAKVRAAVERFVKDFVVGAQAPSIEGVVARAGSLQIERGKVWVTAPALKSDATWRDVAFTANAGAVTLSIDEYSQWSVTGLTGYPAEGSAANLTKESAQRLKDALVVARKTSPLASTFARHAAAAIGDGDYFSTNSLPSLRGARLKAPPPPREAPHARDPGAFEKKNGAWCWRPADGGALGKAIPIATISSEALDRAQALVHRVRDGARDATLGELERALRGAADEARAREQSAFAAAEERVRAALAGLPSSNVARDVFLELVGATTPEVAT